MLLYDLAPANQVQVDLFGEVDVAATNAARVRMQTLDAINARFGKGKLRFAAEDLSKRWQPKHQMRSPRYTSNWDELPLAHIIER